VLGVLCGEPLHQVDLGADGERGPGRGCLDGLLDEVGRAVGIGGVDDAHRALRVHDHAHVRVRLAGRGDLVHREALMHAAEPVPEHDLGGLELLGRVAAEGLARVPHRHPLEGHPHGLGGVAAEVLVGEEENAAAAGEGPLEHGLGVGGGADDAAVLAAERLQRGRGIHVGDRDHGHAAVDALLAAVEVLQLFPAIGDGVDIGHIGHRAAGGEVG